MAYTLNAAQIAALISERDNLQSTLDTYDSVSFVASVNTGIEAAINVDNATLAVWTSAVQSTDGSQPRETVLEQLDGITPNRSVIFSDMDNDEPLYNMGAIQPVISNLTDEATSNAVNIESSFRIRLNINRYYPDVDDKDDKPDSDSRNVFPDHPWFAYAPGIGSQTDYQGLTTLFQNGLYGTARGTPAMSTGNGPDPAGITPAVEGTTQTTVTEDGVTITIGDSERFYIYFSNYLSVSHSTGAIAGTNTVTNVSNISRQSVSIGGTCSLSSTATGSGTTEPATYSPSVGDILSLNGGLIQVVEITAGGTPACAFTPGQMGGAGSTTCTTTTSIRYLILTTTDPSNGNFTNGSQGAQAIGANKRGQIEGIKRFRIAQSAGATTIANPALTTQAEITTFKASIVAELGTQTSLIYQQKYNIANTRCNWNNGTLSALISRENSRLNLFNPQQLVDDGLIPTIVDFVNEYTRTSDKIAEIQTILDGSL